MSNRRSFRSSKESQNKSQTDDGLCYQIPVTKWPQKCTIWQKWRHNDLKCSSGENKNVSERWLSRVCLFPSCISADRESKAPALPGNAACWCQCGQRTVCTLLPARVNHQTTATTRAAKPVNNTSMTRWKARAFGALCWAFGLNFKWSQYLTWLYFGFRSPQLSLPGVTKANCGVTHEWRHGRLKNNTTSWGAPASPCDLSGIQMYSRTPAQACSGVKEAVVRASVSVQPDSS